MKRLLMVVILICFLVVGVGFAEQYNAIIYCNTRNPEVSENIQEHWKPEIPSVGINEVIRDFKVLERQTGRFVVHALVDVTLTRDEGGEITGEAGQVARIKDHIRVVNGCTAPTLQGPTCTTLMSQQILTWWDRTATGMYTKMWQDRSIHAVFETIAKGVLRYPVLDVCSDGPCTRLVSITEAEDIFGETIISNQIVLPHKFYGIE